MAKSQNETIININEGDREEGYFWIGTSKRSHAERVFRRIGGQQNALKVELSKSGNEVTWWSIKLPIKYLSKSTFGIRRHSDRPKRAAPKNSTWLHKNNAMQKSQTMK